MAPAPERVRASLLGKKIAGHEVDCWLINTGWTGGPYGTGERNEDRSYTRAMGARGARWLTQVMPSSSTIRSSG